MYDVRYPICDMAIWKIIFRTSDFEIRKGSMKSHILIFLLLFSAISIKAQYIAEVHEYKPAPGQLINETPWGTPASAQSIIGGINGSLSLGAFGGYVVFSFDEPVQNHPDNPFGVDFTIFGNPMPNWSEPGIVWVMQDENGNGQPDDTWFQLAGSDYWFSSTQHDFQITYSDPGGDEALDVPWNDNFGNSGVIMANAYHTQPYYPIHDSFPDIPSEQYFLEGTCLNGSVDTSDLGIVISNVRAFGYADNHSRGVAPYTLPDNPYTPEAENAGGDAFDLSWAVDESGNYVELDEAHFIKLQTGVLANGGWIGEVSTEITGACRTSPDPGINGSNKIIVIKDLPQVVRESPFQLEAFVFVSGRLHAEEPIAWETNQHWASVDENSVLTASQNGEVEFTASLENYPEISMTVAATIELSSSINQSSDNLKTIVAFPNPANDHIRLEGLENATVNICDQTGKLLKTISSYNGEIINIQDLPAGFYLIQFADSKKSGSLKLLVK